MVRVLATLIEIDLFDFSRSGVRTRGILRPKYQSDEYMWYSPVYTSVCREMIFRGFDFYTSAIKYSDFARRALFVDLGCGLAKTLILANESSKFDAVGGVEIDEGLWRDGCVNLGISAEKKTSGVGEFLPTGVAHRDSNFIILGNADNGEWIERLVQIDVGQKLRLTDLSNWTFFVFNKNSYGRDVLSRSIESMRVLGVRSIVYLYQNPVHDDLMKELGFRKVMSDGARTDSHKNRKYGIYVWHERVVS